MADVNLTGQALPLVGSIATSTTMMDSEITLPQRASTLNVYLDAADAGTWGYADTDDLPLPGQQWIELWRRPTQRAGARVLTVYVAAGSGTPTLYYRVD